MLYVHLRFALQCDAPILQPFPTLSRCTMPFGSAAGASLWNDEPRAGNDGVVLMGTDAALQPGETCLSDRPKQHPYSCENCTRGWEPRGGMAIMGDVGRCK